MKNTGYDQLAWFYNRYWGSQYHSQLLRIFQSLVLSNLRPASSVLDLCCGTGNLAKALAEKGYKITGIDSSGEMIRFAKANVPEGTFFSSDARQFELNGFDAAVSVFDSINHVTEINDVEKVFRNVFTSLLSGGYFFFDLLLEEAYKQSWNKTGAYVEGDNACFLRGGYDPEAREAHTEVTMFRLLEGEWKRMDCNVRQRCYDPQQILSALTNSGFYDIEIRSARKDYGLEDDLGTGRVFFLARKP